MWRVPWWSEVSYETVVTHLPPFPPSLPLSPPSTPSLSPPLPPPPSLSPPPPPSLSPTPSLHPLPLSLPPGDTASELLVSMGSSTSLEDFYPAIAINSLMRILKDQSLSQHHTMAIQALGFIFKSLGIKSVPYLPQVRGGEVRR